MVEPVSSNAGRPHKYPSSLWLYGRPGLERSTKTKVSMTVRNGVRAPPVLRRSLHDKGLVTNDLRGDVLMTSSWQTPARPWIATISRLGPNLVVCADLERYVFSVTMPDTWYNRAESYYA